MKRRRKVTSQGPARGSRRTAGGWAGNGPSTGLRYRNPAAGFVLRTAALVVREPAGITPRRAFPLSPIINHIGLFFRSCRHETTMLELEACDRPGDPRISWWFGSSFSRRSKDRAAVARQSSDVAGTIPYVIEVPRSEPFALFGSSRHIL